MIWGAIRKRCMEVAEEGLSQFFWLTPSLLDERQWRLLAASVVEVLGRDGQARVAEATGMGRNTLIAGSKDLAEGPILGQRVRHPEAGPKRKVGLDSEFLVVLNLLVAPESYGDPMSSLRWTSKSTKVLATVFNRLDQKVGAKLVVDLLHYMGYSHQGNTKVSEGFQHADRDGHFTYINVAAAE